MDVKVKEMTFLLSVLDTFLAISINQNFKKFLGSIPPVPLVYSSLCVCLTSPPPPPFPPEKPLGGPCYVWPKFKWINFWNPRHTTLERRLDIFKLPNSLFRLSLRATDSSASATIQNLFSLCLGQFSLLAVYLTSLRHRWVVATFSVLLLSKKTYSN